MSKSASKAKKNGAKRAPAKSPQPKKKLRNEPGWSVPPGEGITEDLLTPGPPDPTGSVRKALMEERGWTE